MTSIRENGRTIRRPRWNNSPPWPQRSFQSARLPERQSNEWEADVLRVAIGKYLPDLIFGANDGIITTLAVVSG
ncbi:MAG TPA: hypothetical protein VNQ74_06440, partial [Burkholderiaceae bacterium]|nr:hypothetical protein [Burkholderiaceae bacterium]